MTTALALALMVAIGAIALGLVHIARDYAEDRKREQRYADEWASIHRNNQRKRT